MRTTINLDDEMLEKAVNLTGIQEKARLMNFILDKFVRTEAAKRLRKLAGTMPNLDVPSRSYRDILDDDSNVSMIAEEFQPKPKNP